jgi:hypothetical protein
MRPYTPHYVVTVDHSITYGRHFYASSSIINSILGIVHTFAAGYGITNTSHDYTRTLLRKLMVMWHDSYTEQICK